MIERRKIFVSYKHGDKNVAILPNYYVPNYYEYTARSYVNYLIDKILDDEIYKGEGNEDLSDFKDEAIETHLKNNIYDSSITLVLISPNMKEPYTSEKNQWIPWEISYSLKEITRNGRTSKSNAIVAVVLPDKSHNYGYANIDNNLFQIIKDNINNHKYDSNKSYICSTIWSDFIRDKNNYLNKALEIRDNIEEYNITKEIYDG